MIHPNAEDKHTETSQPASKRSMAGPGKLACCTRNALQSLKITKHGELGTPATTTELKVGRGVPYYTRTLGAGVLTIQRGRLEQGLYAVPNFI